jgi:single-strand DNA-binding protein
MRAALATQPGSPDTANEDWAGVLAPGLAVVLDGLSAPDGTGTGCRHGIHRSSVSRGRADRPARQQEGQTMTEPSVSFAGNLTDDPELRHTEAGIARAMFQVAVSGRREQEPSFFTVVVWRDQAEHAAQSLSKGSRVVVVGRLQQRSWTAEDGSARSTVEVLAEELGPSLRWATAMPARITKNGGA